MGTMELTRAEAYLFKQVEHGEIAAFAAPAKSKTKEDGVFHHGYRLKSEVIRHIVLGLPLIDRRPEADVPCMKTGRGISIRGARIVGRLVLDSSLGPAGSPLCPMEFVDCTFEGGFSGVHAHFSRLSFLNCTFADRRARDAVSGSALPTIDLSESHVDRSLDLRGVGPVNKEQGVLWVRAPGLLLGGNLDLSGCTLRAPAPAGTAGAARQEEETKLALDLSLSDVRGDLSFLEGSVVHGGFKLRSAQVAGSVWMRGAAFEAGDAPYAILMQGMRIGGFLMMDRPKTGAKPFECTGALRLNSVEVGLSFHLKGSVTGAIVAHDLRVREDVFLRAEVVGKIDLRDSSIGGSLDLFGLDAKLPAAPPETPPPDKTKPSDLVLTLQNAKIGRALTLVVPEHDPEAQAERTGFHVNGLIDLRGVTCGVLEDDIGAAWGDGARIRMNQFSYAQTGWPKADAEKRPASHILLWKWVRAKVAETWWLPRPSLEESADHWEPWQRRRNWIYRHMGGPSNDAVAALRRGIREEDYRPQPFEHAIRVARAEGREDFATHFEVVKQRLEWSYFNERVRWWLGFAAIVLAASWLAVGHEPGRAAGISLSTGALLFAALVVTLIFMVLVSTINAGLKKLVEKPRAVRRAALWIALFSPALLLFLLPPWWDAPFHFLIAFLIFMAIRFLGVLAHIAMRFGFGYLRRPVRAIVTLIGAFLLGWWAVHLANARDMFVVAAEPSAGMVVAAGDTPHMASEKAASAQAVAQVSCAATISEPLYALDILIPIVDLGEESRCDVRRIAETRPPNPDEMNWSQLYQAFPQLALDDHRFWWWMRALYAIAGWIIVSLALLTFAQVNRTRGESTATP